MHLLIVINLSPYTGTPSYCGFPRIFLQKSLRMRIRFGYSFFRQRKDGMIQEMIYQEQLHYKSQLCPVRAEDFLYFLNMRALRKYFRN
jgi:hypothetical protein